MKKLQLERALSELHRLAKRSGSEINIEPSGISLWTSDANDFQCQDVTPEIALIAIKALKDFRKYWKIK